MKHFLSFTKVVLVLFMLAGASLSVFSQQIEVGENEGQLEPGEKSCRGLGFIVNQRTNSIQLIDSKSNTLSPRYFQGSLGHSGLMDVAITSDGRTAIVSSFKNSRLYFFDISGGFNVAPGLIGWQYTHLFAEDLAITPDDKYVLVADGAGAKCISVIEIASHDYILHRYIPGDAQAIAIAADGETVIAADYNGGLIHTLLLDSEGMLTYQNTYRLLPFWPCNIAISPDGKTVIVVFGFRSVAGIFSIYAPGKLSYKGTIPLPANSGQSCIFSKDGSKAYYLTSNPYGKGTMVHILDVTGPGEVSASGTSIQVMPTRGPGHLLGVDTMALDPTGKYLYVTNNSTTKPQPTVTVLNLKSNKKVKQLWTGASIPLGIAFTCSTAKLEEE
jgi:DNA-binding beta-propeller fold protein YncE